MPWFIGVIIILLIVLLLPNKQKKEMEWMKKYTAHRGYFSKDQKVPENSMSSFKLAIERKLNIEFDVRMDQHGKLIVFHDATLTRMCGVDGFVEEMDYGELSQWTLGDSDQKIPTLKEVLDLVDGQVGLIIEIKSTQHIETIGFNLCELLDEYPGKFAICSFHPMIVYYFKRHRPQYIRGQIIEPYFKKKDIDWFHKFFLILNGYNFLTQCNFVSYKYDLAPYFRWMRLLSGYMIVWTIDQSEWLVKNEKKYDGIIAEHLDLYNK